MSFEDEMQTFLTDKREQVPAWQKLTAGQGQTPSVDGVIETASGMIEAHGEALLLVAREIDKLRSP